MTAKLLASIAVEDARITETLAAEGVKRVDYEELEGMTPERLILIVHGLRATLAGVMFGQQLDSGSYVSRLDAARLDAERLLRAAVERAGRKPGGERA